MVISHLESKSAIELIPYDKVSAGGFQDMMRRKPIVAKLAKYVGFRPVTPLSEIIRQAAVGAE
jgi:UDP-glucose 4-epimerase